MNPVARIEAMIKIDFLSKISNTNPNDDEEESIFISSLIG